MIRIIMYHDYFNQCSTNQDIIKIQSYFCATRVFAEAQNKIEFPVCPDTKLFRD